jgi:hypothetical protein
MTLLGWAGELGSVAVRAANQFIIPPSEPSSGEAQ